ncbi:sugar nucleotide-binding protein [Brucella sp. 2280]|nr:sugar nucleotide-binding protein [Brucella sp. 2280]
MTNWSSFVRVIFSESARFGGPTTTVSDIAAADYPTKAARPMNSRLSAVKLRAASLKNPAINFVKRCDFQAGGSLHPP